MIKGDFYTWKEFQKWLKEHPEVVSGNYYKKNYKNYNDQKLPWSFEIYKRTANEIFGNVPFNEKGIYTLDEFKNWLKKHPEITSGDYYKNHYKDYNDPKLPADTYSSYDKSRVEIFGSNRNFVYNPYTLEEFKDWLKKHPEVISSKYYRAGYKKYNDPKLPPYPHKVYGVSMEKLFGNFNLSKKVFYTEEEFLYWLKKHPEVVSGRYYTENYNKYKDNKLPSQPWTEYNKSSSELFGNVSNWDISDKKRSILEEKIKISQGDIFILILLCGEESVDLSTIERVKSYYKTLGGVEEKIFDPFKEKKVREIDGHRLDDIDITKSHLSTEDIMSIIKYDVDSFWNYFKDNNENLQRKIDSLITETGGEYFNKWKNIILEEYNKVKDFIIPESYTNKLKLTIFQKLSVLRFMNYQYYGIWSDTGLGKTLSYIMCSMYMKSKMTVIFCPNTTTGKNKADVESVRKSIESWDKNQRIYFKNDLKSNTEIDYTKNNYVIFNYEQGQLPTSDKYFEWFAAKFNVDLLIFDELQNLKVISDRRTEDGELSKSGIRYSNIKKLRLQLEEKNPDLKVLASTATVYVNTPAETISMMEMMTGKKISDIPNKNSFKVGARLSLEIFKMGLRETKNTESPNYIEIKINGDDLRESLNVPKITPLQYIYRTVELKIKNSPISEGCIIYTKFLTGGVLRKIKMSLEKYFPSLKVCEFTGMNVDDRYSFFKDWQEKKYDVIIGSDAIIAGIDGFQKRDDSYFVWTDFVWTDKDRQQLSGRINFRGMYGKRADIYIPQIYIDGKNKEGKSIHWSYDEYKKLRVDNKHSMSNLIMNRTLLLKDKREERKTFRDSMELLNKMDFTKEDKDREKLEVEPINLGAERPLSIPRRVLTDDIVGNVHFKTSVMNPENIKKIHKTPEDHKEYIDKLSSKRKNIDHIKWIISQIKDDKGLVADVGCGDNIIRNMIENPTYSFDIYKHDPSVIECNIINLPIPDEVLDYAIYSLSIEQARGEHKYIREARRVIKTGGTIIIVTNRPIKRFVDALNLNNFKDIKTDTSDSGILKFITAIKY